MVRFDIGNGDRLIEAITGKVCAGNAQKVPRPRRGRMLPTGHG
jgi:hypothetical protein